MRATDALPPKAERYTCADCGLTAPAPTVVPLYDDNSGTRGRCSNRQACAGRIRRRKNKTKEIKHA